MNKEKGKKVISLMSSIIGVLLITSFYSWFKPCDVGENIMRCTYSCRVVNLFGVILVIIGLFQFFSKEKETVNMNTLLAIVVNVCCIIVPRCSWFNGIGHSEAFHTHKYN